MNRRGLFKFGFVTFAALCALPGLASAADRVVTVHPPATAHPSGVPPLPAIVSPLDDAERRINTALGRLDAQAAAAARECKKDGGKDAALTRSAEVTMHGPGFLSYLITDEVDCGGAHPDSGAQSIVYDLTAGSPVDWARLLPASLVGAQALERGSDGGRMVTLASRPLFDFYISHYAHDDPGTEEQTECLAAVKGEGGDGPPPMMVWLDAASGGFAMQFQLPTPRKLALSR